MGNKTALCIGINEYSKYVTSEKLEGCVNDALLWKKVLEVNFGFEVLPVIKDAEASFENLEKNIIEFLRNLNEGDLGVIFFSGHGKRNARKGVCYEAIQTFDNIIEGNTHLRKWIEKNKTPKARLVVISDSCYSGTLIELELCCTKAIFSSYKNHSLGVLEKIDFADKRIKMEFNEFLQQDRDTLEFDFDVNMNSIEDDLNKHDEKFKKFVKERITTLNKDSKEVKNILQQARLNLKARTVAPDNTCIPNLQKGKVLLNTKNESEIMIAACWSNQLAYEDKFENGIQGVFTQVAIEILKENSNISYSQFYDILTQKMVFGNYSKYNQKPLLQGNNQFKNQIIFKN